MGVTIYLGHWQVALSTEAGVEIYRQPDSVLRFGLLGALR